MFNVNNFLIDKNVILNREFFKFKVKVLIMIYILGLYFIWLIMFWVNE